MTGSLNRVGGVFGGMLSNELVGVTVGAIMAFEGDASPLIEVTVVVCDGGDCSKLVSVLVKLRTGIKVIGGPKP